MSIYELDPRIRRLLSLDNFLDNLTVYEFIEELSKDQAVPQREVSSLKHLDPKPFIRTFESTLRELHKLTAEAVERQHALEKEVSRYELDHSRNILSLTARTDSVNSQFKVLDDQITAATDRVSPLSQELSRSIAAKNRSKTTISLIQIYTSFFHHGKSLELNRLIEGDIRSKRECASTVSQLLALSEKLISDDLNGSKKCHEAIQACFEDMENSLLDEFNEEYRNNNWSKMRDIADILTYFNNGSGVIKSFVNQHNFFIQADSLANTEDQYDEAHWDNMSDPTNQQLLHEPLMEATLKEIKSVIQDETVVILDVFTDPIAVLSLFVQRIYAQHIQSRVERLLKNAMSVSSLAFLRVLYILYTTMATFTKELKSFFQSALESHAEDYSKMDELFSVLDQSSSDLFTEHLGSSKYFDMEKKMLEAVFYSVTSTYETANEANITYKLSGRVAAMISNNGIGEASEYDSLQRKNRIGHLKDYIKQRIERTSSLRHSNPHSDVNGIGENSHDLITKLSLEAAETLLKSTVESLSRMIELTPTKIADHASEILEILLVNIGRAYVDLGLEVSFSELSKIDHRTEDLSYRHLYNVKISSQILFLVSSSIRTIILPLANNSPQVRQRIIALTNGYVSSVEKRINIIMQDTLSLVQQRVMYGLSKQKKKDFLPKVGELVDTDTPACESLCQYLEEFYVQVVEYLDGDNLKSLLNSVGMFVFNALFEHYKNFQINSTGGIVVTKDIISFQNAIAQWGIPELSNQFQLLREIANLFTVQPELLNSLTKEGEMANVKPYVLRQFIMKRSDYSANTGYLTRLRGMI
ncbi:CYFA0S05e00298g1_1 [Cyberlindnera fabianii]|uniref:CYFA0S05e00298g1_1 n=1 Tax=Cyberlindnera fabianii TaxID=36022 RepID=A0A061AYD0_CYBFA|nr:CYFA0S05e00298g1_1 [Cyberlindnera fabianii]